MVVHSVNALLGGAAAKTLDDTSGRAGQTAVNRSEVVL